MRVRSPAKLMNFLSYYPGQGVDVSLKNINQKDLIQIFRFFNRGPTPIGKVLITSEQ